MNVHATPHLLSLTSAGLRAAAVAARQGGLPRAIVGGAVYADAGDPRKMMADLAKAFEDFKSEHDKKLSSKVDDVIVTEKVDRINTSVGELQAAIEKMAVDLAAAQMHAGTGNDIGDLQPTSPEYLRDFKAHMRKGTVSAAMDKGTDAAGGYLAPVEWDRSITQKLKRLSMIRQNARVVGITVAGFKKLFSDRTIGSGWVGETAARPATTTPAIGILDFTPGEIYANPAISQQLLDDAAINLETWLGDEVETEFARQEGIAFLSGDGANKPYGILTYVTGGTNAARHPWGAILGNNSGNATLVTADSVLDMMYSLPSEFAANAKIYTNRLSLGAVRKLKDGQGNYLWQPSYVAGEPPTIAGAPVVEVPDMPNIGAGAKAFLYGDMEATYLVVDRIGISVLRDPFTNKPYVHFYTVKRVGGGVYNPEPMRYLNIAV